MVSTATRLATRAFSPPPISHRPEDLASEVEEAEFKLLGLFGVQGVARVLTDFDYHWEDEHRREHLLEVVRSLETEPSLLGLSNHIMAVGEK